MPTNGTAQDEDGVVTDHRRGLEVARRLRDMSALKDATDRAHITLPAADAVALVAYTHALAMNGRCPYDVSKAIDEGETRCALPADEWLPHAQRCVAPGSYQLGAWGHSGACMTWEGVSS